MDKISAIVKNVFQKKLIYLISYKHIWLWLDWVEGLYLGVFTKLHKLQKSHHKHTKNGITVPYCK